MNFDIGDDGEYPRIEGSRVSPTEQLDNVPLIQDAIAKGVIPPNLKIANEMLQRLGWPELTAKEWKEAKAETMITPVPPTPPVPSPAQGGPGRPSEAGPDDRGRDDKDSNRLKLTEKKTIGDGPPSLSPVSWRWLRSTAG